MFYREIQQITSPHGRPLRLTAPRPITPRQPGKQASKPAPLLSPSTPLHPTGRFTFKIQDNFELNTLIIIFATP